MIENGQGGETPRRRRQPEPRTDATPHASDTSPPQHSFTVFGKVHEPHEPHGTPGVSNLLIPTWPRTWSEPQCKGPPRLKCCEAMVRPMPWNCTHLIARGSCPVHYHHRARMVQPVRKSPGLVICASRKRLDAQAPCPAFGARGSRFSADTMRPTREVSRRTRYL